MSDTEKKQTLSLANAPKRLELRRRTGEAGQVKQSFSHGRTKTVQVEVRKKRTLSRAAAGAADTAPATPAEPPAVVAEPAAAEVAKPQQPPKPAKAAPSTRAPRSRTKGRSDADKQNGQRQTLSQLNDHERQARARALEGALAADEADRERRAREEARRREEDARRREEERLRKEAEEIARREEEKEAARQRALEEAEKQKDAAAKPDEADRQVEKPAASGTEKSGGEAARTSVARRTQLPDEEEVSRLKRTAAKPRAPAAKRADSRRRSGKLTVAQALDDDSQERMRSLASVRRERERQRQARRQQVLDTKIVREVTIPETITVQELANRMAERARDVVKTLMQMDVMATINQVIDADTAELVVAEMGHRSKRVSEADVEIGLFGEPDADEDKQPRPPVVTIMGHVDHGKTSLLDAMRESNVVSGEAGGITQHIGAYQVQTGDDKKITFIDTPGHEAFTAMRARGAKVTDIVVLVVAADDGVMPQTIEAINHARAAEVPIVLAINKIDKPDSNPDRVKQELLQHNVIVEEMGGEVLAVAVSALQKTGLDKLEEAILLTAELLELTANPDRTAEGVIAEAKLDRGRGPVATVLVQRGTLQVGDIFVAGREWGRVRALLDSSGNNVDLAAPAFPVEVLGLNGTPNAGDDFSVVETEARAREIVEYRRNLERDRRARLKGGATLETMFTHIKEGQRKHLPVVVKGDVQGSVEAIAGALGKLKTDEVDVQVVHSGVGAITESDVALSQASEALVIGFNVRANAQARDLARQEGVEIRYYSIIYELVDEVKKALTGLLEPEIRETVIGNAQILEVFNVSKSGKVAGCRVTSGQVRRNARVRLLRDNVVIHEGAVKSLRHLKDEVREVREGSECGIALDSFQDIQTDDVLELFEVEEIQRSL